MVVSRVQSPPLTPASLPVAASHHWSRLKISLLWIYRGDVPAGVSGYMDTFLALTAWQILQGSVETVVNGRRSKAVAGEWLFPKPAPRIQKFSKDARILSVRFRIEWPNGDQLFNNGLGLALKSSENPELETSAKRLERVVEALTQTRYRDASMTDKKLNFLQYLRLEKAVHLWAETVYRVLIRAGLEPELHEAGDPRIHTILDCLERWPLDEPFKVTELAQRAGLSRSNLERVVGKAIGMSSKSYFDRRRIEHALHCLRNPGIPVKQIAIETGFAHASSFCAWFKGKMGCYPGEMATRTF